MFSIKGEISGKDPNSAFVLIDENLLAVGTLGNDDAASRQNEISCEKSSVPDNDDAPGVDHNRVIMELDTVLFHAR